MKPHYQSSRTFSRGGALLALASVCVAESVCCQTPDAFNPNAELGSVSVVAIQPDGKVLVGGLFSKLGGQTRDAIGRLNPDGTLDTTFNPGAGATGGSLQLDVKTFAIQMDGKILVGGQFTHLAGQTRSNLGRLNADGTLDTNFNPGVGDSLSHVGTLAVQPDNKILVGGRFTMMGGEARTNIGRLNANGTLDTSFNPGAPGLAALVNLQTDGKILVTGTFTNLAGQAGINLVRLNTNGTFDTTFNPGTNGVFLAVLPDGRILVTGSFTNQGGQDRKYIARLGADGTVDSTFNVEADFGVGAAVVQADGKIIVGGGFTNLAGQVRKSVARLNPNGTLDTNFNLAISPGPSVAFVNTVAVQADGKIILGGAFSALGGQPRIRIGRVINTDPATQSLAVNGSTITWLRGGTSPELWRATFDYSVNGTDWTNLGEGVRIPGGWQLADISVPASSAIRARGFVVGGRVTSAFVESTTRPMVSQNDGSFGFRSNQFGFSVSGSAGQVVVVEGSTNQSDWVSLWTNTFGSGPLYFSDPGSGNFPWRLYRARHQ